MAQRLLFILAELYIFGFLKIGMGEFLSDFVCINLHVVYEEQTLCLS